jgi:2-polyprenyl-6-methoxyphenol hydroxylase-like FAD-dependent oxidoreductase
VTAPDDGTTVLIAGGGIAGLVLALTCHQIGVDATVLESARELRPLGVGINLQPNATRELFELGLEDEIRAIGVESTGYGFYTKFGEEIWVEPRGVRAGYRFPQFSIHRGELQMLLFDVARERLGADRIRTGARIVGYENAPEGDDADVVALVEPRDGGSFERVAGTVLVGADGLNSAVRAQIAPDQGPPHWNGAIMWRGATRARPFGDGASMALIGHDLQRFVTYPISRTDPDTGEALVNWIAELRSDPGDGVWRREGDWNRRASAGEFLSEFTEWRFGWVDVPDLVKATDEIFEYPMIDRDPLDRWRDGRVTLVGDAAHVMYPVGSNGASQAVVDGRKLGRAFLDHGVTTEALDAYEAELLPATAKMVLQNRGRGPDYVMQMVEDRSGGVYDDLYDVVSYQELADHAARYKGVAGLSIEQLNAAEPIIPPDRRRIG